MNHHAQLIEVLKDLAEQRAREKPVFLPMMTQDQQDAGERKRLEMQRLPWALPERKED